MSGERGRPFTPRFVQQSLRPPIMSMIENGHLEALHGGQEGAEEAVLV